MSTKIEFVVKMNCESCVKKMKEILSENKDIKNYKINTNTGTVLVDTSLPSSEVLRMIEGTGLRTVIRGFGQSKAAVAIVESFDTDIKGVVRFMQFNNQFCIIDGTVDGLDKNCGYKLDIHESGDVTEGGEKTGDIWCDLGVINSDSDGCVIFKSEIPMDISNIIGRSLLIKKYDKKIAYGIIGRSAGIFQNSKTICACDGGWHILRKWDVYNWDFPRVLEKLHAEYRASPFFKITVEPNPRAPQNNSIRISPSGLGLPDRSFYYADIDNKIVDAYKRLLKDVVILMTATSSDAVKFSTDIFFFEKRIAEITPDTKSLQDPVKTYNPITVSELKITAASLPLREILVSRFPKAGITDETEVIVSSPDYLTAVSGIVSNTDRSALNNYIIWTVVREYLPYLPSEYTSELQEYISELTGVKKSLQRWEVCSNMVQKFMGLAVHAMLEKNEPVSEKSKSIVESIFKYIKNAAVKHIRKYDFPVDLEKHTLQKISSLDVQVGLPPSVVSHDYLVEYYKTLYVQKSNLFQNVYNCFSFSLREQQMQYMQPKHERRLLPDFTPNVVYSPAINTVIVPRTLLIKPYFSDNYSSSVLYGRIGVDIANGIIDSIMPWQVSWTKEKGLLSQYHSVVNQSEQMINYSRHCVTNFLTKHQLASEEVANLSFLSTLKHLSSVRIAHTGLQLALEHQEHIHLPTLEIYEDSAIFYITYSQGLCSIYTDQYKLLQNLVDFKLTEKELLTMTWNHVPTFSSNFVCEKTSFDICKDIL